MTEPRPRFRVVQLLATGTVGGAQGSVIDLMRGLDPPGFAVEAVCLTNGPAVARMRELGLRVTVIDDGDDRIAVRRLADHLSRARADVVHAHMYRAELVGARAARAARMAATPAVVATVHSSRVRSPEDVAALAADTPLFDHLIAPSAFIADKVRREGRGAASVSVIPNGVDLDRFNPHRSPAERAAVRAALRIPADAFLVGVVARLEPEKGHRHLLAAWPAIAEAVPGGWLLVAGTGSLADALRAQARALDGDAGRRVVFAGLQADVAALTAALDLAVLPSLREAQGIALLEAMASGVSVVASAVCGIPETVRDGVDGRLVPPADPDALSTTVIDLARHPSKRAALARAGRRRVDDRFSLGASVLRTETVYDQVLHRYELPRAAGQDLAG
jgi:glycosyltransferase involved in cell wall biosynthesis